MGTFFDAATSFPTAIFSTLLAVALLYWVLALVGLVDFDSDGLTLAPQGEGALEDPGALASALMAFGFHQVPTSIVLSAVILVAWTLSCLGAMWLLPWVPGDALAMPAGAVLALASLSAAVPTASVLVRPLRGLFVTHAAERNASLVGQTCKVLTRTVDERLGRAEVARPGATLNIRVWARTPNALVRGAPARIVAYEERTARYQIEADA